MASRRASFVDEEPPRFKSPPSARPKGPDKALSYATLVRTRTSSSENFEQYHEQYHDAEAALPADDGCENEVSEKTHPGSLDVQSAMLGLFPH